MPYKLNNGGEMQQYSKATGEYGSGTKEASKTSGDKKNSTFLSQPNKKKQLEIIKTSNPMLDDYHVGIRKEEDIKTFEEAMQDDESFYYGDYDIEDAKRDLKRGKVKVYSSKPFENGGFVSTSRNMAQDYAGSGKVYEKEMNINDIAWINGDEGQIAMAKTIVKNDATAIKNKMLNTYKETKENTYKSKLQKDFVDYFKQQTNIDLEKARDKEYDNRNVLNLDDRKLNNNEKAYLDYMIDKVNKSDKEYKVIKDSNGAHTIALIIKKRK